jgi:hypothetical protein
VDEQSVRSDETQVVEELDGPLPVFAAHVRDLLGRLGHMGIETQSVTIGEASSFPVYRERGLTEGNRRHEQSLSGNHVIDEAADLSKGLA